MISTLLKVIRWKLLLYLAFVFFLFKYCFLYGYGFQTRLSFVDLGVLTIAISLLLASSLLVLFYFRKQTGEAKLFLPYSKKYAIIFGLLGLLISILLSFKIQKPSYCFFLLIYFFFITIISKKIQRKTFMSNILRPFLRSSIVLIVCWIDFPVNISSPQLDLFIRLQVLLALYIVLSFLSSIVREIIIDLNNINYDYRDKNKTLPVLLGRNRSKKIVMAITTITCFGNLLIPFLYINNADTRAIVIVLVSIPELFFIYKLMNASTSEDYKFLHKILNIIFLLSFLSIPLISYHLKHVNN